MSKHFPLCFILSLLMAATPVTIITPAATPVTIITPTSTHHPLPGEGWSM